ncbi:MAG: DNA polymerase III subunit delta [Chloroflexi bacterium RBG_16_56_11]|nr:MAG: DNA polymerase III subunit delta [Chloroflexi bacterium RBG_16_56_11]
MLHVLVGKDDFSIRQALEAIKKGIGDATALMTNTTVLDGRQATLEQIRNSVDTVPFLAEKRLVIVEGLLERFGPPERTARKKPPRASGSPDEHRKTVDVLKNVPPFTELVIIGSAVRPDNPLLRAFSSVTTVRNFPLLKEPLLRQWIEQRVKAAGGSISPRAVALLVRFVGNDLWIMAGELDKLVTYAAGRPIEETDVREVVSYTQEASIFSMVDAILEFRAGQALGLLQRLLREGVAPAHLLAMISRQVRIIVQVKDMRARGKARGDIQKSMGLSSDFLLRKAWEQADGYSAERLHRLYHRLLEADLSVKTGTLDGELALNILVAELGQTGTAPASNRVKV